MLTKLGARLGLLVCALAGLCLPANNAEAGAVIRPSIVVILSDDEDVASHRVMERTRALIEDHGTVLENYFVTYSFCCPSRTDHPARPVSAQPPDRGQRVARRRVREVHGAGAGRLDRRDMAAAGRRLAPTAFLAFPGCVAAGKNTLEIENLADCMGPGIEPLKRVTFIDAPALSGAALPSTRRQMSS